MIARGLNRAGSERLRAYLTRLRAGESVNVPVSMLEDARYTHELPLELTVEPRRFISRLHVGAYLCKTLAALPYGQADASEGLWSWLSLFYHDSLCPRRADGTRRPGADHRHVADFRQRSRYGHLLYGPYLVYRRHGAAARVLLSGPPHQESHFYQVVTNVQDLIANRGVLEAATLLYYDEDGHKLKRGCQPSRSQPGTVRRFVRVLQQLDLTYDVYGMSGQDIARILPDEFDPWREGSSG